MQMDTFLVWTNVARHTYQDPTDTRFPPSLLSAAFRNLLAEITITCIPVTLAASDEF